MSGGFAPHLTRTPLGVDEEISFLASEHMAVKRAGITLDSSALSADADGNKILPLGTLVTPNDTDGKYVKHGGMSEEVQTATITGDPDGGDFTLTYSGQTTAAIAWNATGPAVKAALEALSNIGAGDVSVSKSGWVYTITFGGALSDTNVAALTAADSLTGGTTPGVTIATVGEGAVAGAPVLDEDVSGYLLESYNLKGGDVVGGILIHGSVLAARVSPSPDATIRAALKGRITFQ